MKKFNSQICTTREQSERLLALGVKKETADMAIVGVFIGTNEDGTLAFEDVPNAHPPMLKKDIPAWSLHRLLLLLLDNRCVAYDHISFSIDETDVFTKIINHIEWLIKEGYFNKEYLV